MQFTTVALALAAASGVFAAPSLQRRVGSEWTVDSLTRVCASDDSSCTYTFSVDFGDGTSSGECNIVNTVADAETASWYAIPCNSDEGYVQASWGYDASADPPFATMTIVDTDADEQAYFGVSNPTAATDFGNIGPSPAYAS